MIRGPRLTRWVPLDLQPAKKTKFVVAILPYSSACMRGTLEVLIEVTVTVPGLLTFVLPVLLSYVWNRVSGLGVRLDLARGL